MSRYYVLRDGEAVPVDEDGWAAEFRQPRDHWRIAATTLPDGRWVSTVFLGIDHSLFGGPPLIFETMVFEAESMGRIEMYADRYSTREQALAGHERAIRWCAENPSGGGT